jgi:glycosyltransferase involved in cell wall biosynthesis
MNNLKPSVSLIISTYNWPEALELCLQSIIEQKVMPTEIIIADDGSTNATKVVIEKFKIISPVPINHLWHEDIGFRLAKIRNKAIAKAKGEYIIQIDGDLILNPYFVKDHIDFAVPNSFVRASRIYINSQLTENLLKKRVGKLSILSSGISNKFSALRLPIMWPLFEHRYKVHEFYEIHGCNMAFWKANAIQVNGYNEDFVGWGPEDKEFVVRLINSGFNKRFIKMGAMVYHLWHPENTKAQLKENELIFKDSIVLNKTKCKNGLNQYL